MTLEAARIERVVLHRIRIPFRTPFVTGHGTETHKHATIVEVLAEGVTGWGECASPSDPYYCPETTGTCWHILEDFLAPSVLGRDWETIDDLTGFYSRVKGNNFAKAGLEMACWDLLARRAIGRLRDELRLRSKIELLRHAFGEAAALEKAILCR